MNQFWTGQSECAANLYTSENGHVVTGHPQMMNDIVELCAPTSDLLCSADDNVVNRMKDVMIKA